MAAAQSRGKSSIGKVKNMEIKKVPCWGLFYCVTLLFRIRRCLECGGRGLRRGCSACR